MKKTAKIIGRVLLAVLLAVYVAVAAVNYPVVQTYLGGVAGRYFSSEWGGTVRIGSLGVMPLNYLSAHEVLLVSPDGDTVLDAETLRLRFHHFPYQKGNIKEGDLNVGTLDLDRLLLRNAYYHFEKYSSEDSNSRDKNNLYFIIDYYRKENRRRHHTGRTFTVKCRTLELQHVHYRMDLPDKRRKVYAEGVEIPHMEFYDICGKLKDVHVVNDDVRARILSLRTEERSGFRVDNIKGDIHSSRQGISAHNIEISTPQSHIEADVEMQYTDWKEMKYYLYTVDHNVDIHAGTTVAMADVAYWAPVLWGIDMQLTAEGHAEGPVDRMNIAGLNIGLGANSKLSVDGTVCGLPRIDTTAFRLEHLSLHIAEGDLEKIGKGLPQWLSPTLIEKIEPLQYVDLDLSGEGSYSKGANADIDIRCALGNVRADANMQPTPSGGKHCTVEANSDGLGLSLFASDWLSHTGFSLSLDAVLPEKLKELKGILAEGEVQLTSPVVRGKRLSPVELHCNLDRGNIQVEASAADTLLHFDLDATIGLSQQERSYAAELRLQRFEAAEFGLLPKDFGHIASTLSLTAKGDKPDHLHGTLSATNTSVGEISLKRLSLSVASDSTQKNISLRSDAADISLNGHFLYADLPLMLYHVAEEVVPQELLGEAAQKTSADRQIEENLLNFSIQWNDDGRLLEALGDKLQLSRGTRLSASYNHSELVKLSGRSDSVRLGNIVLENIGLSSRPAAGSFIVRLEANEMRAGKVPLMNRAELTLNSNSHRTLAEIYWGEEGETTHGDLMLRYSEGSVSVVRPYLYIGDNQWELGIDTLRIFPEKKIRAIGRGIRLDSEDQHIGVDLTLEQKSTDNIAVEMHHFNLGRLSHVMLQNTPLDVAGSADGKLTMYGLSSIPYFNANLSVDSCVLNRQSLGRLALKSNWNAELNILNLQLNGPYLQAGGWIGLEKEEREINFAVDFNDLDLALAAPFMSSFTSRFEGMAEGTLDISGTLQKPIIIGEALVEGGAIKVDATGATYYFDDSLSFTNRKLTLNNFRVHDSRGGIAFLNGEVRYNSVQDIRFDLDLSTENLLLLDRPTGENYSGQVFAEAQGTLTGSLQGMNIDVRLRTNEGSTLTVPISNQKRVKAQNFISFVGEENIASTTKKTKKKGMPFNISVDLSLTPSLKLNLPMDFSDFNIDLGATGSGELHLDLDEKINPQVAGSYEIIDGTMKVGMLSLFEKGFSIETGSSLGFQGSLPDAHFDVRAVYAQRVNLSTLTGSLSTIDNTQKYIQVENIIAVAGTLREPTIGFDIRLPNADASVEDEVFAYIDRNSERDMINQTISLLLMGQFYNTSSTETTASSAVSNGLSSGYSMVASTVSGIVSDIVQFVDVDLNYKAATEMTNEQVDFNISKDWGRWYIESTLGYGGESRELETSTANGTVIDATIGYRLGPLIHLFAYNRTNNNDYTRLDLPYKQGVGIKLTKDFDRWSDIFRRRKKNKK